MNVQELIGELELAIMHADRFAGEDNYQSPAFRKAIEAIKVLQEIAEKVGTIPYDGLAIKAQTWITSLGEQK